MISIVVPVHDEEGSLRELASEILAVGPMGGHAPQVIFVDDGSTDATAQSVLAARREIPEIRLLRHSRRSGQSYAVATGVRASGAEWVATLDGDGQNDPGDIPALVAAQQGAGPEVRLVMGNRAANRRDTWLRRLQSRVANGVRGGLLGDGLAMTGKHDALTGRDGQIDVTQHMELVVPLVDLFKLNDRWGHGVLRKLIDASPDAPPTGCSATSQSRMRSTPAR